MSNAHEPGSGSPWSKASPMTLGQHSAGQHSPPGSDPLPTGASVLPRSWGHLLWNAYPGHPHALGYQSRLTSFCPPGLGKLQLPLSGPAFHSLSLWPVRTLRLDSAALPTSGQDPHRPSSPTAACCPHPPPPRVPLLCCQPSGDRARSRCVHLHVARRSRANAGPVNKGADDSRWLAVVA